MIVSSKMKIRKWIVWFLMIPICAVALSSLYHYILFTPLENNMEPTALILFTPIFGVICMCNIMIHLYALMTGLIKGNHTNFLTLHSFIKKGILKWVGLILIICYGYDLLMGIKADNIHGVIWNTLAIVVTIFYVCWFNTFNCTWGKKVVFS